MKRKRVLVGLIVLGVLLVFFISAFFLIGQFGGKSGRFSFGGKIAIVEIKGVISQSHGIIQELREYQEDDSVKAIVLRIDSPGGGVAPSQEIYRQILKIKKDKKIVTSMGSVAASGGYYIACASDLIVANPGTVTGSIGVVMQFSNFEELMKKIGIKGVVLKAGEHKDIGSPFRDMTPEERSILQEAIDNIHQQFIQAVAEGRKMDRARVLAIADGRILTGEQAKKAGLVDQLGNLEDTIETVSKMVGISGRPNILYPRRRVSFWDYLFEETTRVLMEKLNLREFSLDYLMVPPNR